MTWTRDQLDFRDSILRALAHHAVVRATADGLDRIFPPIEQRPARDMRRAIDAVCAGGVAPFEVVDRKSTLELVELCFGEVGVVIEGLSPAETPVHLGVICFRLANDPR